jgi:hypothetical protein
MDRAAPAAPFPPAPAYVATGGLQTRGPFGGAKPIGPRACCSHVSASADACCKTKWTAQRLLRPCHKHRPMLQQAGCKPAVHLVAQNQLDREHVARLYPHAPPFVATCGLQTRVPWRADCQSACCRMRPRADRRSALQRVGAPPIAPPPKSKDKGQI